MPCAYLAATTEAGTGNGSANVMTHAHPHAPRTLWAPQLAHTCRRVGGPARGDDVSGDGDVLRHLDDTSLHRDSNGRGALFNRPRMELAA